MRLETCISKTTKHLQPTPTTTTGPTNMCWRTENATYFTSTDIMETNRTQQIKVETDKSEG